VFVGVGDAFIQALFGAEGDGVGEGEVHGGGGVCWLELEDEQCEQ